MAELADALDSKSGSFGSVGSTPTLGTIIRLEFIPMNEAYLRLS